MNRHLSILIRGVQALDEKARLALHAELKLKHNQFATFCVEGETVIAVLGITEHNLWRLVEHHRIIFTLESGVNLI